MKLLRKAQVGGLQGFMLAVITISVVLTVGLIVLSELQTIESSDAAYCGQIGAYPLVRNLTAVSGQECYNSSNTTNTFGIGYTAAHNSTRSVITKLATVPTWIGIVIIVALAFIVLSFFIGKKQ